jgi:hypothetical protein
MLWLKARSKAWERHRVAGHLILKAICESQSKTHSSLTSRNPGFAVGEGTGACCGHGSESIAWQRNCDEVAFGGIARVHRKGAGRPARGAVVEHFRERIGTIADFVRVGDPPAAAHPDQIPRSVCRLRPLPVDAGRNQTRTIYPRHSRARSRGRYRLRLSR